MTAAVSAADRGLVAAVRVRLHEMRQSRAEYLRRRQRVEALAAALQSSMDHLRSVQRWSRERFADGAPLDPDRVTATGRYLAWQQRVVADGERRLAEAEVVAEQGRSELLARYQDLRALRRLVARHRERRLNDEARRLALHLDELGALRRYMETRNETTEEATWQ